MNKKHIVLKFTAVLLAIGAMAFSIGDKKAADKKAATPAKKAVAVKGKKQPACCEQGIPDRFAAAGSKVLKKTKTQKGS